MESLDIATLRLIESVQHLPQPLVSLTQPGPRRASLLALLALHARVQTALSLLLVLLPLILFVAHQLVQRLALSVNLYLDLPVLGVQQERIKAHPPLPARHAQRALLAPLV